MYDEYQLDLTLGARLDRDLAMPQTDAARPVVAVAHVVPVCPPQLDDTDDAAVDVPEDGDCLFRCLQARRRCLMVFPVCANATLKCKHEQHVMSVDPPRQHWTSGVG